jgi:hypothetical protein
VDTAKSNKMCSARLDNVKISDRLRRFLLEQIPLLEAFLIAVSIHVVLFPVVWLMGWLLPWPKSPVITTVVEYDLRNWPIEAKQKKWQDVRDPNLNK